MAKGTKSESLNNLINFNPKSALLTSDENIRRSEFLKVATGFDPTARSQMRARDLLGAVLAISARTRRIVQPKTTIAISVFSPTGKRAITLSQG